MITSAVGMMLTAKPTGAGMITSAVGMMITAKPVTG